MIPLSDIIRSMSLEEQGKFVSFLKKNKQNPDSQKLKLYKLIKEEKVNPKLISVKLIIVAFETLILLFTIILLTVSDLTFVVINIKKTIDNKYLNIKGIYT